MSTIAIAKLKAQLSAQIKRVRAGETLVILDHQQPVAKMVPLTGESLVCRTAQTRLIIHDWSPLITKDIMKIIESERADSW